MANLGRNRMGTEVATPVDGRGSADGRPPARYCAGCGQPVSPAEPLIERFGEPFCSEAHAEAFVTAVRGARVLAAALAPATETERSAEPAERAPQPQS